MNPQQPPYGPPSQPPAFPTAPQPNTGQYDFITAPQQPHHSLFGGGPKAKTIAIITGGAVLVIVLVWFIFSSIFGGQGPATAPLVSLAQKQNELVRISSDALNQATEQTTKNLAANVEASLQTDQTSLLAFLQKHGTKVNPKVLAQTASKQTDSQLASAQTNGTYDHTYISIIQSQLTAYEQSLKSTFDSTTNPDERQLLSNEYANAQLLLQQSNTH